MDIMQNACADLILGQKFLQRHEAVPVTFVFGGFENPLVVRTAVQKVALAAVNADPPRLFELANRSLVDLALVAKMI